MPKLGRRYEEAVFAFARTLDPQAEVIFDHSVLDRDTGTPRQCDVWINAKFGGHWPLSILVSCKDHRRKLHAGDIGTFRDEVRSTGASMGVIYSRTGFTKPAVDKAKASGLACCRIYRNEPADVPLSIWFEQFVCTPSVRLSLESDLRDSKLKTWHELFELRVEVEPEAKTILDVIAEAFAYGEGVSLSEVKKLKSSPFPLDWAVDVRIGSEKLEKEIRLKVIGHWKRYRALTEAILLNGSYCVSDNSYKGGFVGPSIDTQGTHPGEAWTEITSENSDFASNRIIIILQQGDVKAPLREHLGPCALYLV